MSVLETLQEKARCGCCLKPMQRRRVNLIQLQRRAKWEHPVSKNIFTGYGPCAVAISCDSCLEANAVVYEAIEVSDGEIIYHDLGTLEDLGPQPTHMVVNYGGRLAIRCLVCGSLSYHPDDVINLYCGRCHQFHPIGG